MHRMATWHLQDKVEFVSGLGASLVGLAALAFTLFAPRWRVGTRGANGVEVVHYVSTLQLGQPALYLLVFTVLAFAICGVSLSVMAHLRSRRLLWSGALLGLTLLLVLWILYPLTYPTDVLLRLYYVLSDNGVFLAAFVLASLATLLALRTPAVHTEMISLRVVS